MQDLFIVDQGTCMDSRKLKIKKSIEIGQDKKSSITTFAFFLTAIAKV